MANENNKVWGGGGGISSSCHSKDTAWIVPEAQMGWNAKYFEGLQISFLNIAFDIFTILKEACVDLFFSVNTDTNVA